MSGLPRGVPSLTYVRICNSPQSGWVDCVSEGTSTVTVLEKDRPSYRHEVAQVLDRSLTDEEVCESIIGTYAGAHLGINLNPVSTFVLDSTTAVILLMGSMRTKKWDFLRQLFLPFLANELYANQLLDKESTVVGFYDARVVLSAFGISSNEVVTDLLRPSARGLSITFSAEDGINMAGIQKECAPDETSLRALFEIICESRASRASGSNGDCTTTVWEIELRQSERGSLPGEMMNATYSRLIVVDVASVDPLLYPPEPPSRSDLPPFGVPFSREQERNGGLRLPMIQRDRMGQNKQPAGGFRGVGNNSYSSTSSNTGDKSLRVLESVLQKLASPYESYEAPFRDSVLTHYLSELLGGNAIVVGLGFLAQGEPAVSRKTLEMLNNLSKTVHFPMSSKETSELMKGLIRKYRTMAVESQVTIPVKDDKTADARSSFSEEKENNAAIAAATATIAELTKQLEETEAALEYSKNELIIAQKTVDEFEDILNDMKETEKKIQEEETLARKREEEYRTHTEQEITELQSEVAQKTEAIAELQSQIQQKTDATAELEKSIEALRADLTAKTAEVEAANQAATQAKTEADEKQALILSLQQQQLEQLQQQQQEQKPSDTNPSADGTADAAATAALTAKDEEISTLRVSIAEKDKRIDELEKDLSLVRAERAKAMEVGAELERALAMEKVELARAMEQVSASERAPSDVTNLSRPTTETGAGPGTAGGRRSSTGEKRSWAIEDIDHELSATKESLAACEDELAQAKKDVAYFQAKMMNQSSAAKVGDSGAADSTVTEDVPALRSELTNAQEEIKRLTMQLEWEKQSKLAAEEEAAAATASSTAEGAATDAATTAEAAEKKREQRKDVFVRMASELETRNAGYREKNAALEAELKTYKEYMSTTILEYKNKVNTLTKRVKDFESGTATAAIEELKKAVDTVSNRKGSVKLNGSFVGSPESKKETDAAVVPATSQPEDPTKLKSADESAVGDAGQSDPKTAGSS